MTNYANIAECLKQYFGFDSFKGDQEAIIKNVIAGYDTFVLMPTGGGKSLCYQLPALIMEGVAIVVSPLIALMKNQVDVMRSLSQEESIAHFLNSSLTKSSMERVKKDVLEGRTKILYVAPETLTKEDNVDFFKKANISFYAIDEAHCISEWGHDFRIEYRNIRPTIDIIGRAPIIALTATATYKVKDDILKNLGIPDAFEYRSSFNRKNLYYEVRTKTPNTYIEIVKFIKKNEGKSGIIYCLSRKEVEDLAIQLRENGIKAAAYHAGMETAVRSQTQDDFLMERIDVIVATIAFGMGIDKPDVRFVIHYDIPKSIEGYYQETGRAGRDGGEGQCIAFFSQKDIKKLEKYMEDKTATEQEIGRQLLKEISNYAESSVCRRKFLLHYFDEEYDIENCGNCDNCLNPKKKMDAKDKLCDILKLVIAIKENFDEDYILNIINGKEQEDILINGHDELDQYGIAEESEELIWKSVLRQGIVSGYMKKDIENLGAIKITPAGKKFLKNPETFMVTEDNEFEENAKPENIQTGGCAGDPVLYQMLKDLRNKMAEKLDIPPYVIFQDPSLEAMATTYPINMDELKNIVGVGTGKASKYGTEFCDLIRRYCSENEIERPDDIRVRTIANKSKLKISIIQCIDRHVALDDIAESNGIDFYKLLDETESIVYSGTKLNIDYFLEEVIEDDKIEEIYNYFKKSKTDNLKDAMDTLGDDFSDIEIRLVRLKFISEMAN